MKYSREEQAQWMKSWLQSGLSKAEFCRQHSLEVKPFYSWFNRNKRTTTSQSHTDSTRSEKTHPFSPVVLESITDDSAHLVCGFTLDTENGIKLFFEKGARFSTVMQLIQVLAVCT